jgi:MFS family permease
VKQLLATPGFRKLLAGQAVSALGDWMVTVALMALVLQITGSSAAVGAILVLRLLPVIIGGPLAARVSQRWDRRKTMVTMDLFRAGIVVLFPLFARLWWVYPLAFLLEVGGILFLPARDSSIPDLVGDGDLTLANGLVLGSSYGTLPLGAGAFAAVSALTPHGHGFLNHHPYALVFWVDAVTFLVSFEMIRRLSELGRREPRSAEVEQVSGLRAAFRVPLVRAIAVPTTTVALGLGALFSLGVTYVHDVLGASDTEFGVFIALFGVGAATGLGVLRLVPQDQLLSAVRWGTIGQGATIAAMSALGTLPLGLVGAALFGAAAASTLAAGMSCLQEWLSGDERVLAFTAFHVTIRGGLALAAMGAGVAADVLDAVHLPLLGRLSSVRVVLVCSGLLVIAGAGFMPASPGSLPIHASRSHH